MPVEDAGVLCDGAVRPASGIRRPALLWLLRDKVRNSLPINFILGIWVYGHKPQAKFEDGHHPIQDGRLAAIFVRRPLFLVVTRLSPQFFINQSQTWHICV